MLNRQKIAQEIVMRCLCITFLQTVAQVPLITSKCFSIVKKHKHNRSQVCLDAAFVFQENNWKGLFLFCGTLTRWEMSQVQMGTKMTNYYYFIFKLKGPQQYKWSELIITNTFKLIENRKKEKALCREKYNAEFQNLNIADTRLIVILQHEYTKNPYDQCV